MNCANNFSMRVKLFAKEIFFIFVGDYNISLKKLSLPPNIR